MLACSHIREEPWGWLTDITLPASGRLGIYQPKHEWPQGERRYAAARAGSVLVIQPPPSTCVLFSS